MLATLGGVAVLVLLAVDVFMTVLDSSSGAGPYTALQNRVLWRVVRAVGRRVPWRDRTLSLAAPLMALATPIAWVAMLTLGFGLLYRPVIDAFPANPPVAAGPWVTALYYAGYLTTTLGLGDVTPSGAGWRAAAVLQSALGFALFSAAITYVLSIYSRHTEDASFALSVHNLLRDGDGAGRIADSLAALDDLDTLARELSANLSGVNVAHRQYPILHYFHDDRALAPVVQVGRLIDLVEGAPDPGHPGVVALRRSIGDFFDQMPFSTADTEGAGLRERHEQLLEAHLYRA